MRYLTAGESHGKYLTGILEGFPAGVKISPAYIAAQLRRRRLAPGRSARQAVEKEDFEITAGLSRGATTGAPIAVLIKNAGRALPPPSSLPRPGHADLAGMLKYGCLDAVLIRERASARETAARVALGSFARRLLELLGVAVSSRVTGLAGREGSFEELLREARRRGDTLGGSFEVAVEGLPAGLGSCMHWDRRLSARLASALTGINGVKAFEIGWGSAAAELTGRGAAVAPGFSGGLDGGMTTGGPLVLSCAVKPVPGLPGGVPSTDLRTFKKKLSVSATSDTTAVFAAAVIGEHAAALELAGAVLEKFGGDSLPEIKERVDAWRRSTGRTLRRL